MSLITSVIFTVLGGLVAGGVGYIAAVISLREQRKQKHLEAEVPASFFELNRYYRYNSDNLTF